MSGQLILHPSTRRQLNAYLISPAPGLLLLGLPGSGKNSLARHVGETLLKVNDLDKYPYALYIKPEEGKLDIGIDAIRQLNRFVSLKVASDSTLNQVAIVRDAQRMSIEAQNALLKLLEEPPPGTVLILTADNAQALLPTVRSRLQTISVALPEKADLAAYFDHLDEAEFERVYALSGGAPGLLTALAGSEEHPLRAAADTARLLLTQTSYERLLMVDQLSKDKTLALNTLTMLQRMATAALKGGSGATSSAKWQRVLEAAYT
ncbi:MAG: hypothetical protein ACREHG_08110, partial [Candidatus Saccharimonadales bacterium]